MLPRVLRYTKEDLEREIEQFRKTEDCMGFALNGFLNNFFCNAPYGSYRAQYEDFGWMDIVAGDNSALKDMRFGDVLKGQTIKEFFSEIDDSLHHFGISLLDVRGLQGRNLALKTSQARLELNVELVHPYIDLRCKGYLHYPDLFA